MLIKTTQQITRISDDNKINSDNMFECMNYVDNIYNFINKIKLIVPINEIEFLPSFKGRNTCAKYSIMSKEYENEMRFFVVKSGLFLVDIDKIKKDVNEILGPICDRISYEGNKIAFILK